MPDPGLMPDYGLGQFSLPGYAELRNQVLPPAPAQPPALVAPPPAVTQPPLPTRLPVRPAVPTSPFAALEAGLPPMPAPPRRIPVPEPPKPNYTEPMKALGNPLSVLALIASTFVRNPGIAAGNAMAAAMDAQKKGDQLRYANAYKEYTQQIDKVAREQDQENKEYEALYKDTKLKYDERMAALRMAASKRKDNLMLQALGLAPGPMAGGGGGGAGSDEQFHMLLKARAKTVKDITLIREAEELQQKNPDLKFTEALDMVQNKGKVQSALGDVSLQGDAYLQSIPAQFRDDVKAIAEGRKAVPPGKWGEALSASAFHLNPNLQGQTYSARGAGMRFFASGQGAQSVITLNQMMGHMANTQRSAAQMRLSNWRTANKAIVAYARETNDPVAARFLTDLHVLQTEAANVFKGNRATEGEIKRQVDLIESSSNFDYMQAQLQELQSLIKSRMDALAFQYSRSSGVPMDQVNLLSPHAQEAYKEVQDAPPGGKLIGHTPEGKPVFKMPDGKNVVAE